MTTELARSESLELEAARDYLLDVQRVVQHAKAIQSCIRAVMIPGKHYGVIPGTEKFDKEGKDISKPCLYQPGADVLMLLFRLRARYTHQITKRRGFYGVKTRCRIIHIPTGEEWGEAFGSANSGEDRYRNQSTQRTCPKCKKPTIYRSKAKEGEDPDRRGWFCWKKHDGCGANFEKNDPEISGAGETVVADKVHNLENTILKMSAKRAKVAAVIGALAASDAFDQDLDDLADVATGIGEAIAGQHGGQPTGNGNGNGNGKPATNGNGNGGASNGVKRASPVQIRDLGSILGDRGVAFEKRIGWINMMLESWGKPKVTSFSDIAADDAEKLKMSATNGEGME